MTMSHSLYISTNLGIGYLKFLNDYIQVHVNKEYECISSEQEVDFERKMKERREDRIKLTSLSHELQMLFKKWYDNRTSAASRSDLEEEIAAKYRDCEETIRWLNHLWEQ